MKRPNYGQERAERQRRKAARRDERVAAKAERRHQPADAGPVAAPEAPGEPGAVLSADPIAMARLAQSSEFTILRTGGLGPGRALSLLAVATVLAVAAAPVFTALYVDSSTEKANPELTTAFAYLLLPQILFYGIFALLMAILNAKPRNATAEVTEKARVLIIDAKTFETLYRAAGRTSVVKFRLPGASRATSGFIRSVQRNPLTGSPIHVDYLLVNLKQEMEVDVPLVFVGEAPAVEETAIIPVISLLAFSKNGMPSVAVYTMVQMRVTGFSGSAQPSPKSPVLIAWTGPEKTLPQLAPSDPSSSRSSRSSSAHPSLSLRRK